MNWARIDCAKTHLKEFQFFENRQRSQLFFGMAEPVRVDPSLAPQSHEDSKLDAKLPWQTWVSKPARETTEEEMQGVLL